MDQNTNPDNGTNGTDPTRTEKTVPYERFQKVNEAKKQAEETLSAIATELLEDVPDDMRDIVPDLPPADKIKWLRNAIKKGVFTSKVETSGPDSKRPGGKTTPDYDTMSPSELISLGLQKR
jgi:anti-sigma28 factor (negative regulator of flagellin synthesis)